MPKKFQEQVIKKLYEDALAMDWEHLSGRDHTRQYAAWLEDREVGGVLLRWMSSEEARVWIKDVPMKEFSRALSGIGDFAIFVEPKSDPAKVVAGGLGGNWRVVEGTVAIKPMHCEATDGQRRVRVYWGKSRDFKHLIWAALVAADAEAETLKKGPDMDPMETKLVVITSAASPVRKETETLYRRLAERCGFELRIAQVG